MLGGRFERFAFGRSARARDAGGSIACFAIVFLFKEPGGRPGLRLGFGTHELSTTGGESSTGSQAFSGISSSTFGSAVDISKYTFVSVAWPGKNYLETHLVIVKAHDVPLEVSDRK